jgi:hypothetical protein
MRFFPEVLSQFLAQTSQIAILSTSLISIPFQFSSQFRANLMSSSQRYITAALALAVGVLSCDSLRADYVISVVFGGTGSGSVLLTNNTTSGSVVFNTNASVTVADNDVVTATGTAANIGITASASNTTEFSNLNVSSVYTRQSTFAAYNRNSGTSLNFPLDFDQPDQFTSASGANVTLNYTFDLADAFTNAAQFQYFFTTPLPGLASLNQGDFFTSSASSAVPWTAFSALGVGTNRSGTLRVIDAGGRSSSSSFNFDISPSGGGAAVPEPSSFILISAFAGAGVIGRRFLKKRKQA